MDLKTLPLFSENILNRQAHLRYPKNSSNIKNCSHFIIWRGKLLFGFNRRQAFPFFMNKKHSCLESFGEGTYLGEYHRKNIFLWDISESEEVMGSLDSIGSFNDSTRNFHPKLPNGTFFCDLRSLMPFLKKADANICATAKGINEWQRKVKFCVACGAETQLKSLGWEKVCTKCKMKQFPRLDPVVIMLVRKGNNILLGRSNGWPKKMYSCLAGFIEPGETIEAAVKREVMEESGIRIKNIRYIASQPWPFPASLMIGCVGDAINKNIKIDANELEDALWVDREKVFRILNGLDRTMSLARKGAIARYLIEKWVTNLI